MVALKALVATGFFAMTAAQDSCTGVVGQDVNGDGEIKASDVTAILSAFGTRGGAEDADGNGVVDVNDILAVVDKFGCRTGDMVVVEYCPDSPVQICISRSCPPENVLCPATQCAERTDGCCAYECASSAPVEECSMGANCGGQVYTDCGTACPNQCGVTLPMMCNMMCYQGYQCEWGQYWEPSTMQCVATVDGCITPMPDAPGNGISIGR